MAELIADLKINTTQFQQGVEKAIRESKNLSTELEKIGKGDGFDKANKGAKLIDNNLEQATKQAKALADEVSKVGANAQKSGSALSSVFQGIGAGAGIGLATAGIELLTSALTESIGAGFDLVKAQDDLAKKTGLTGEAFAKLKKEAQDAFVGGVGESVAEATKIIANTQNLLGNVLPADQLGEFTAKAQTLGRLYEKDVNEVLAKSTPFIKQFGLDGDKAFNLIALASQKSQTSQDDTLDTLAEYSQLLDEAGFSAEDFVATLVQAGDDAQFGTDKIADAIKEAQIRLRAGDTNKALAEITNIPTNLRKTLDQALKDAQSGKITVKDFLQITGKDIEAEFKKGNISQDIQRQLQTAIAGTPAEDIGSEFYGKVFGTPIDPKVIEAQAKKAGEAFNKTVTFDSVIKEITGTIQVLSADVIKILQPAFATIVGIFKEGNNADGLTNAIRGIASAIASVLPFVAVFLKATFDLSQIFTKTLLSAIQKFAENFSGVFGNTQNEGVSFFETISAVGKTFGDVIGSIVDIVSTYLGLLGTVWGSVFGSILGNYSETEKGTTSFSDKVVSFAQITSAVVKDWASKFNGFINSIKPTLSDIGNFIGTFAKFVGNNIKAIYDLIVGYITALVNIFKFFGSVIGTVVSAVSGFINSLFGASKQTKSTGTAVQQTGGFFSQLAKKVDEAGGFINYFTAILAGASSVISNFAGNVSEAFKLLSSGEFSKGFDALYNSVFNSANAFTQGFNKSLDESKKRSEQFAKEQVQQAKEAGVRASASTKRTKEEEQRLIDEANGKTTEKNNKTQKGITKTVESELKKQQKLYEEANEKLTNRDSEYYKKVQELEANQLLTTAQKAQAKLKLDQDINTKRIALIRQTFQLEGKGINDLSSKFKTIKGDDLKTVKSLYEKELIDFDKLGQEKTKLTEDRLKREQELNKKFFETFVSDTKDAFGNANEFLNLKVDEAITSTALIEQLKALGIEVEFGAKLNQDQLAVIGKASKEQLETILSDIQLAEELVKDDPKQAKALQEFRFKVEDALKGIKTEVVVEPKTLAGSLLDSLGGLANSLSKVDFKIDVSETTKALQEVAKQIEEVDKALAKGEITGEEYQKRIAEIKKTEEETLKGTSSLLGQLGKSAIPAFTELANNSKSKLNEINEQFRTNEKFVMNWGEVTANAVGFAAGSFAKYREETDSTLKAVVLSAIDTLNALVPILTAQIFGLYASSTNPANIGTFGAIGIAAAGVVTSALLALVKSAVAGFETGGLVKGGEQMIRINEKGQEYVVNANATRRNQALLEHLNSGNDRKAYELLHQRYGASQMMVNGSGQLVSINELQAIKTELQMLRSERTLSTSKVQLESTSMEIDGNKMVAVINSVNRNKSKLR